MRPVRELHAVVAISGDAQNVATWLQGRNTLLKAPDFNALQARFEYLGGTLKPKNTRDPVLLVADNPAALQQRLLAHDAMIRKEVCTSNEFKLSSQDFSTLSDSVTIPEGDHWYVRHLKQKWLHAITGWSKNGIGEPSEQRAWCLYSLGPDLDASCWPIYAHLLCKLGDSEVLCNEWKSHQQKHGGTLEAAKYTIKGLMRLKDFKNAWRLAYKFGDVARSIQEDTWELLAHPQESGILE